MPKRATPPGGKSACPMSADRSFSDHHLIPDLKAPAYVEPPYSLPDGVGPRASNAAAAEQAAERSWRGQRRVLAVRPSDAPQAAAWPAWQRENPRRAKLLLGRIRH